MEQEQANDIKQTDNYTIEIGSDIMSEETLQYATNINDIIKNIEETFNVKLPQDYINYMEATKEYTGMIKEKYYDIWKLEDIISRNNDYHVQEFFPNLIYFGSNGGDEAFAFDKSNNMSIVSIPFIGTEEDKMVISDSFNNFINK